MATPTLTTEKPVREQLRELFFQMAKKSFDLAMVSLNKANFYDVVIRRLAEGADISEDIPEAKKMSAAEVITVARQQRQQSASAVDSAWELSTALAGSFRTTVRSVEEEGELIPKYDVEHVSETEEGQARISIKTWRRNISVEVQGSDAAINALNAQMAMAALQA
jgi:hypothetical protein